MLNWYPNEELSLPTRLVDSSSAVVMSSLLLWIFTLQFPKNIATRHSHTIMIVIKLVWVTFQFWLKIYNIPLLVYKMNAMLRSFYFKIFSKVATLISLSHMFLFNCLGHVCTMTVYLHTLKELMYTKCSKRIYLKHFSFQQNALSVCTQP